jgi:hypothetical protein
VISLLRSFKAKEGRSQMRKNSLSIKGERFFEKYGREDPPVWIVNSNREVEKRQYWDLWPIEKKDI